MKMRLHVVVSGSLALLLAIASPAWAGPTPYAYGNFNGLNFDFLTTGETVQVENGVVAGALNAQFEAPIVSGDQLIFSPTSFEAFETSGAAGITTTHSTLSTTITSSNPAAFINQISITEGGDIVLSDFPPGSGSAATGVGAVLSGTVTVLAAQDLSAIGQIVTFGAVSADFTSIFTPGPDAGQLSLGLQPAGAFAWTGSVLIDLFAHLSDAGVTSVQLVYNNILTANSQLNGSTETSALIQKKAISGPVITVIPEPATALLLCGGLLVLAISRSRNRRA